MKEIAKLGKHEVPFDLCEKCKKWFAAFEVIQLFPEDQDPYFACVINPKHSYCPFCGAKIS